jgi:hypothetical protein
MGHVNSVLMAVSKFPNPTVFQKTLAVNDLYFGARGASASSSSKDWRYRRHPRRNSGHVATVGSGSVLLR